MNLEELKEKVEEFGATFAAFKAANDAELKKHDVVLSESVTAINGELTRLSSDIAKTQTILRRGGHTNGQGDDVEAKHLAVFNQIRKAENRSGADLGANEFAEYRSVFASYCRGGLDQMTEAERATLREGKALSVGTEADGGYWVLPAMSDRVIARQFETSPIRAVAAVQSITSDSLEVITDPNDLTSGGWVGEKDSRAETATPEIGKIRISVHEQFANPRATQKLLDDAGFNVETWLADKIADKLGRVENTAFVSGNGVDQPRGFMDYSGAAVTTADASRAWGVIQYVATGKAGTFDTTTPDATTSPADELIDLVAALKPQFRNGAVWVMSRATEAAVRKIKDTNGDYVITANTGNITGAPFGFNLLGFPIATAEDMPAMATDAFPIAFGNFREGYQIVDRQGIRTLRDPFSAKPYIQFYTTKRVGGNLVNSDALKLLKTGVS